MATNEERLKILTMLQNGVINADQAAKLLEALAGPAPASKPIDPIVSNRPAGKREGKYFRVRVTDTDTGKTRVNVRLPVGLVGAGIKMGMKFSPELEGVDTETLQGFLESGEIGQIVDVFDEEDGEHVEVFIE
ncbi:MAG: hypothetical protein CVU39_13330 [Chloroflexi bacterium HGW-Chloroflexi-10]|nr:MAG: hypothetical protein CVU39_13330 [Chloroflexi bacterium HGW-Chloroflexi-10]